MTPAFSYRRRRSQIKPAKACVGETITLDERTEYVLSFPGSPSTPVMQQIADLGGELLAADAVVLSFGNFVGRADLAGVTIDVTSTKIGDGGVSRLLEEVSDLASGLVFGWRAPTTFVAVTGTASEAPVPYHQLQLLRHFMLKEPPGQRLQDWISAIERNPTRRFEPDRPVVSPDRVRRLDHRAVQSIFTRVDRLVPAGAAVSDNDLAQALSFGTPREPHFPAKVAAPRGRLSFDTPENRFVKHVLGECLSLIYRFIDHPKLHAGLRADCRTMLGVLEDAAPFLAEVGRLSGFHSPSQALAKADGYREVFGFCPATYRFPAVRPKLLDCSKGETWRLSMNIGYSSRSWKPRAWLPERALPAIQHFAGMSWGRALWWALLRPSERISACDSTRRSRAPWVTPIRPRYART